MESRYSKLHNRDCVGSMKVYEKGLKKDTSNQGIY